MAFTSAATPPGRSTTRPGTPELQLARKSSQTTSSTATADTLPIPGRTPTLSECAICTRVFTNWLILAPILDFGSTKGDATEYEEAENQAASRAGKSPPMDEKNGLKSSTGAATMFANRSNCGRWEARAPSSSPSKTRWPQGSVREQTSATLDQCTSPEKQLLHLCAKDRKESREAESHSCQAEAHQHRFLAHTVEAPVRKVS